MGGGMPKENLLIVLPFPEDTSITDKIRQDFPYIDVRYHQLKRPYFSFDADEGLPKDLFRDATILVTFASFPASPEDAPNLHLLHLLSAGVNHLVSNPLFTQTDIPITTSSGIHGPTISEWILMSTLVLSKNYKTMYELQKEHKWGTPNRDFPRPADWVGKKVGIAGYGSIGRQVARVFTSLGCEIYAYTSSARSTPASRSDTAHYHLPGLGDPDGSLPLAWYSGATKPDLHTFLSQDLDILVISLPLTPSTRGLFAEEEWDILSRRDRSHQLHQPSPSSVSQPKETTAGAETAETAETAALAASAAASAPTTAAATAAAAATTAAAVTLENKPTTVENKPAAGPLILNISRGAILHQPSLISALKSGALAGAALDVTDPEPLQPDSELWDMPNVVVTPHMSGLTTRYLERAIGGVLVENLGRRERGEGLVNLVHRKRGY